MSLMFCSIIKQNILSLVYIYSLQKTRIDQKGEVSAFFQCVRGGVFLACKYYHIFLYNYSSVDNNLGTNNYCFVYQVYVYHIVSLRVLVTRNGCSSCILLLTKLEILQLNGYIECVAD